MTRLVGCAAVTVGRAERLYGGPEEGGWWYDHFCPLRVLVVPCSRAATLERRLERWAGRTNAGEPALSSVMSRGRVEVRPGVAAETEPPRYG